EAPARARVRGRDELHARREANAPGRACHDQLAVLERLTQRLERTARELGELVEEQDAARRQRDLAGARAGTAADQRGRRCAVMPRAERPAPDGCAAHL